jgi:hypothetical protein
VYVFVTQGENVIHGLYCRITDLLTFGSAGGPPPHHTPAARHTTGATTTGSSLPPASSGASSASAAEDQLFGVLHSLVDHSTRTFKVRQESSQAPGWTLLCLIAAMYACAC